MTHAVTLRRPATAVERGSPSPFRYWRSSGWILLVGAFLRLFFFFVSENNGGDAVDRVAKTLVWSQDPTFQIYFGAWLPLPFWLGGFLTIVIGDATVATRLISLVAGIVSLFVATWLSRELFGEQAARYTAIAISFYTVHIAYSTTSSSEALLVLFALSGLACFFRYWYEGELKWLALSGLVFTMGSAVRYEIWVVMAAAGVLLLTRFPNGRIVEIAIFGLTAGIWPLFWMLSNLRDFGHPLYFVAKQREWVPDILARGGNSVLYSVAVSPGTLLLSLSPLIFAAALYGAWRCWRDNLNRAIVFVWLFFAGIQFYQTVSGGMWPSARFTITQGVLMCLLAGCGLDLAGRFVRERYRIPLVVGLTALNLLFVLGVSESRFKISDKFASITPRLRYAHYMQDAADVLRARVKLQDSVVIDNYNYESTLIGVAAGLPMLPDERIFRANSKAAEEVTQFIQDHRPRFVVYSDRGVFRPYLPLPSQCPSQRELRGARYDCIFANEIYRIYEVSYSTAVGLN